MIRNNAKLKIELTAIGKNCVVSDIPALSQVFQKDSKRGRNASKVRKRKGPSPVIVSLVRANETIQEARRYLKRDRTSLEEKIQTLQAEAQALQAEVRALQADHFAFRQALASYLKATQ